MSMCVYVLTRVTQIMTFNRPILAIQVGHISHVEQNGQHSSSSCKGTSGLLPITGSNTLIFTVLKA